MPPTQEQRGPETLNRHRKLDLAVKLEGLVHGVTERWAADRLEVRKLLLWTGSQNATIGPAEEQTGATS